MKEKIKLGILYATAIVSCMSGINTVADADPLPSNGINTTHIMDHDVKNQGFHTRVRCIRVLRCARYRRGRHIYRHCWWVRKCYGDS